MYSAEKEQFSQPPDYEVVDVSVGTVVMGNKTDKRDTFFVQTKNAVKNTSIEFLKSKIDHLNTLDKKGLRQFYKETVRNENDNPESQGAGARRAGTKIQYEFAPHTGDLLYFTMHVEIH
jgi:hypothetical protein